jgi:hypothetical protein
MATRIIASSAPGCTRVVTGAVMAGGTGSRCSFVNAAGMAGRAGNSGVRPGEWIGGLGVVDGGAGPVGGGMARAAVGALRAVMDIDALMARIAGSRCPFVDAPDMAGSAGYRGMRPGERIGGLGVVDGGLLPVGGVVAGGAVGAL